MKKHKQKTNMFAFIFQITIYAGTNEHSERGSYCIMVGKDLGLLERTKGRQCTAE